MKKATGKLIFCAILTAIPFYFHTRWITISVNMSGRTQSEKLEQFYQGFLLPQQLGIGWLSAIIILIAFLAILTLSRIKWRKENQPMIGLMVITLLIINGSAILLTCWSLL